MVVGRFAGNEQLSVSFAGHTPLLEENVSLASLLRKGFEEASSPSSDATLVNGAGSPQDQPFKVLAVPTASGSAPQKVPSSANGMRGPSGAPYQSAAVAAPQGTPARGDSEERSPRVPSGFVPGTNGSNGASANGKNGASANGKNASANGTNGASVNGTISETGAGASGNGKNGASANRTANETGTGASGNGNGFGPLPVRPEPVSSSSEGAPWQEIGPLEGRLDDEEERSSLAREPGLQEGTRQNGSRGDPRGGTNPLETPALLERAGGQKRSRRIAGSSAAGVEPDTSAHRSSVDANWEEAVSLLAPLRHAVYLQRFWEEPLTFSGGNICRG